MSALCVCVCVHVKMCVCACVCVDVNECMCTYAQTHTCVRKHIHIDCYWSCLRDKHSFAKNVCAVNDLSFNFITTCTSLCLYSWSFITTIKENYHCFCLIFCLFLVVFFVCFCFVLGVCLCVGFFLGGGEGEMRGEGAFRRLLVSLNHIYHTGICFCVNWHGMKSLRDPLFCHFCSAFFLSLSRLL